MLATLAAREPERVERLCLLDPALDATPEKCLELAEDELAGESFESHEEAVEATLCSRGCCSTPPVSWSRRTCCSTWSGAPTGGSSTATHRGMSVTAFSEIATQPPPVAELPTLVVTGDRSWLRLDLRR